MGDMTTLAETIRENLHDVESEISFVKKVVTGSAHIVPMFFHKVKVPEPKSFGGAWSAKELKKFLWDIEQYFKTTRIPDGEKVSFTSMYLSDDAKLWWRMRMGDETRLLIEIWDTLKKELKDQFLPCNLSWVARELLWRLKAYRHREGICETIQFPVVGYQGHVRGRQTLQFHEWVVELGVVEITSLRHQRFALCNCCCR
ncbi:hypothetical protein Acr_20g0009750 [Actinidia rufa]|uniref:Retrotransposon gag domain-containing protein n=1 Tax=Actinidia rufa TaxID=165716 RepID=A0A7J0GED4_9ERIC|nr:hypothetical protein Acr_20g0009750 [Actinidia rufa]